MSVSGSEHPTIPLPSRSIPDIPPKRRDPDSVPSSMAQGSRMTVGPGIQLKGEISNCAALVVEGNVDATLDGDGLEISPQGVFNGTARVETAEIQGQFEGELNVTGLLRIEKSGSVTGKVRYGRIEVVAGGEVSGEISKVSAEEAPATKGKSAEVAAEAD